MNAINIENLLFQGEYERAYLDAKLLLQNNTQLTYTDGYFAALSFYEKAEYGECEKLADVLLGSCPQNLDFVKLKALALLAQAKIQEALIIANQLTIYSAGYAQGWRVLSLCRLNAKNLNEALSCAKKAVQLDESNPECRMALALALIGIDDKEALKNIDIAIKLRPCYAEAYFYKAGLALKVDNRLTAIASLEKTLTFKPWILNAWYMLSDSLAKESKFDFVVACLDNAVKRFPNDVNLLYRLANALRIVGQVNSSLKVAQVAMQIAPDNAEAILAFATAQHSNGILEEAEKYYLSALEKIPHNPRIHNNLASLYSQKNKKDLSFFHIQKAYELEPSNLDFASNLASGLFNQNRDKEALTLLETLLTKYPFYANGWLKMADWYFFKNRLSEAKEAWEKAILYGKPSDFMVCKAAIHNATSMWLQEYPAHEIRNSLQKAAPILLTQNKEHKGDRTYIVFLDKLTLYAIEHYDLYENNQAFELIYAIGESHSLVPHMVSTNLDGQKRFKTLWIAGLKQWHLASLEQNLYKKLFRQYLDNAPSSNMLLIIVGEIDCRADEGVYKHATDKGKNISDVALATVDGYMDFLEQNLSGRDPNKIIIQGVPAPGYSLEDKLDISQRERFLDMIKYVNHLLKEATSKRGWLFFDVYTATAGQDGLSNQLWHLDGYHLKPSIYSEINKWIIRRY